MPPTSPIRLQFFNLLLYCGDFRLFADDCPGLLGGFKGVDNLAYLDFMWAGSRVKWAPVVDPGWPSVISHASLPRNIPRSSQN